MRCGSETREWGRREGDSVGTKGGRLEKGGKRYIEEEGERKTKREGSRKRRDREGNEGGEM